MEPQRQLRHVHLDAPGPVMVQRERQQLLQRHVPLEVWPPAYADKHVPHVPRLGPTRSGPLLPTRPSGCVLGPGRGAGRGRSATAEPAGGPAGGPSTSAELSLALSSLESGRPGSSTRPSKARRRGRVAAAHSHRRPRCRPGSPGPTPADRRAEARPAGLGFGDRALHAPEATPASSRPTFGVPAADVAEPQPAPHAGAVWVLPTSLFAEASIEGPSPPRGLRSSPPRRGAVTDPEALSKDLSGVRGRRVTGARLAGGGGCEGASCVLGRSGRDRRAERVTTDGSRPGHGRRPSNLGPSPCPDPGSLP